MQKYAKVRCLCSNFSWRIRKLRWFNGMCVLSARVAGSAAECGQKRPKESYRHLQTLQSLYKMQLLSKRQTLYSSHLYPTNPHPTHLYAKVSCLCSNFSWRIRKLRWFNGMCVLSARVAGSAAECGHKRPKESYRPFKVSTKCKCYLKIKHSTHLICIPPIHIQPTFMQK